MSPAAAPAIAGQKPGNSSVSIFGRKISWDAILVTAGGIVGVIFLWNLNKSGGAGVSFGQMPTTSDSTAGAGSPTSGLWMPPDPSMPGGAPAPPAYIPPTALTPGGGGSWFQSPQAPGPIGPPIGPNPAPTPPPLYAPSGGIGGIGAIASQFLSGPAPTAAPPPAPSTMTGLTPSAKGTPVAV